MLIIKVVHLLSLYTRITITLRENFKLSESYGGREILIFHGNNPFVALFMLVSKA